VLILEDGWSEHHVTLLRCFLAEGAACGHSLKLATATPLDGGLHTFLPRQTNPTTKRGEGPDAALDLNKGQGEEVKLRIAWQYEKYLRKQEDTAVDANRAGAAPVLGTAAAQSSSKPPLSKDWCHTFDVSKPADEAVLATCRHDVAVISGPNARCTLATEVRHFLAALAATSNGDREPTSAADVAATATLGPHSIGRLAVLSLGRQDWGFGVASQAAGKEVVQSILHIKAALRDAKCAAVVTVPAALLEPSACMRAQHLADAVLELQAPTSNADVVRLAPDSGSVAGMLRVKKLPALGSLIRPSPQIPLHFIRQKRRQFLLTPVEVDPDAEAAQTTVEVGSAAPASSVVCGGPTTKGKLDMDF
jgi:elongator complex protein 4